MQGQIDMTDFKALIFKVGEEEYGVHINQVISIERMQEITSYPNRPAHVLGVTVMREVVTPLVDLRSALMGEALVPSDSCRIILVQVEDKQIGLIVDAATDVLDIKLDTIQHPNLLDSKDVSYLKGISKMDDRLIILLDIEKLLEKTTNIDELKEIKEVFQD
ncbi:purine-binding chemotaxis protein CheW [Bacillus thermocopriae]|jgi:purine-binding chemotaxis protein CheW|uniref:Purine-binding chemotaxis protein CheW n=1 Tax=Neobacillus thermocopriae TaxID=1215031 RepID=A0A6B3TPN8_9BACI|nr:chemotaxis protein CheW [Neobacillus thermocopriae]NEX78071.1 purine-binding chemotaxis protein CheW [Neobacillus thermocopriae]